ncbi:hypothetical protein C8R43DRAFT_1244255 [Mycena crocata]|nr:hypothetical protein C8R43DRAFT_1244255 [Mycena crocata]
MNQCLSIPEIIELICGHVSRDRDFATLARTCRNFQNPALDNLWRIQDTLTHVLKCLPPHTWEEIPFHWPHTPAWHHVRLLGQIKDEDWDRPREYTRRIRKLNLDGTYPYTFPDSDVFGAMCSRIPPNMFQNLGTIRWAPADQSHFHYIHLFLGPSITEVRIQHVTPENISLLPALGLRYPELKSLSVDVSWEDRPLACRTLSKIAFDLEKIEILSLDMLDRQALEHISQLPALKSLDLLEPIVQDLSPISSPSYLPFLTLRTLNLWAAVDLAIGFVHLLSNCHLEEFTLGTEFLAIKTTTEKLYTTLAGHLAHDTLRILEVTDVEGETPIPPAGTIADYLVSGPTLAQLFCFGNLTRLNLQPPVGFDIDDSTAWDLARAWPKLTLLWLRAATELSYHPSMTLQGLRAFAKHCPELSSLTIAVDASTVPPFDGSPDTRISQRRLLSFNVSASPISNAPIAARFLSALFPRISYMGTLHDWRWDEPAEDDEDDETALARAHDVLWKQVKDMIPVMAAIRAEQSNSVESG